MALHRGIQSAVFYYLSCAPCAEARYRKHRKEEAKRSRADRAALEAEQPDVYRHPSPASTNPHWQTEIALGPALTTRGAKRKPASQANTGQRGGAAAKPASRLSSNTSRVTSSIDLPGKGGGDDAQGEPWNTKLYQRPDEYLWGGASSTNLDGSLYNGSGSDFLRRPPTARTRDSARSNYQTFRNPPINDLHPAIATKVNSREEVLWMMQPPPVAAVMSGKERGLRSRSDSGSSRMATSHTGVPLSRNTTRLGREHTLSPSASLPSLGPPSRQSSILSGPTGQPHDRGTAGTTQRDFAPGGISTESLNQRPPMVMAPSSEESVTSLGSPATGGLDGTTRTPGRSRAASRPQLSSIASDSLVPSLGQVLRGPEPSSGRRTTRDDQREAISATARSEHPLTKLQIDPPHRPLKIVQDLTPGSTIFNTHILTTHTTTTGGNLVPTPAAVSPGTKADLGGRGGAGFVGGDPRSHHRRPPFAGVEDFSSSDDVTTLIQVRPELFDAWYRPPTTAARSGENHFADFPLGSPHSLADDLDHLDWVHEHTKREVQQRWSMDL